MSEIDIPADAADAADAAEAGARKRPRALSNHRSLYPRKRAVQACRTCRRRRTKCDNEQPACTSCIDLDIPCIYEDTGRSTFDAASLAILQRLDGLEDFIRSSVSANSVFCHAQTVDHVSSGTTPKYPGSSALESPALERPDASALCHINIETVLSWPIFSDLNLGRRLDLRFLLQPSRLDTEPPPLSITSDFENVGASKLLKRFFNEVHIYNPVLEVETVEEYARHARFNGLGWDAQSCLLLLAYALGSIYAIQKPSTSTTSFDARQSSDYREADAFFSAAQKRMGILLCRSGLIEAQCFFLAGVYLMATLRPIEAWKMFVQALACCEGFSMQRIANGEQSEEETQLQESIYWTCFKSELELRLELNVVNHSVWDLAYPAFFPSPPKGLKSKNETVWYFYLAEIALRRLGNRILNYIYQYQPSQITPASLVDAISNFEHQAEGWLASLPPALNLDSANGSIEAPDAATDEHASLRFILNGHLIDCYEMMYWPFTVSAIHGTLSADAESQSFARKGIQICIQRIDKNENGFCKRHHGTWLMLRSCTRSALILVAAARAGLATFLPSGWEVKVGKVVTMLGYWKEEVNDVPDRLNILECVMRE